MASLSTFDASGALGAAGYLALATAYIETDEDDDIDEEVMTFETFACYSSSSDRTGTAGATAF